MSTKRRCPTDLTDRQWGLVEPLLPGSPPGPAGRKPRHEKREIVNAILRAGGAWRMLPRDLPPWQTVYGYFRDWRSDGTLDRIHDALRERVRTGQEGRNPSPSARIVDSQSVKGADIVPPPRAAMTRARRSTAESATSSSTRSACSWS